MKKNYKKKEHTLGGLPFFFWGEDTTGDPLGTPLGHPLRAFGLGSSSAFFSSLFCFSFTSSFSFPLWSTGSLSEKGSNQFVYLFNVL